MSRTDIRAWLEANTPQYDKLDLECDGMTRVLSYLLHTNNIDHSVCRGHVVLLDEVEGDPDEGLYECGLINPHFWIEVDGLVVDYRLRMWTQDLPQVYVESRVPHGVFVGSDYAYVTYNNHHLQTVPLCTHKPTYDILVNHVGGGLENE